ncbi:TPA: hypothetical protein KRM00_003973 [Clostridioides difficile]|uniref:Uncharacterized protein n=1 Tax=Clostridioides difficile TaxID=1496 RepID=A0AAN5VRH1_CLODI|nr:hypothetical protein [Clostridioides difficile]
MNSWLKEECVLPDELIFPIYGLFSTIKELKKFYSKILTYDFKIKLSKHYIYLLHIGAFIELNLSENIFEQLKKQNIFNWSFFEKLDCTNIYYNLIVQLFLSLKDTIENLDQTTDKNKKKYIRKNIRRAKNKAIISFLFIFKKMYINGRSNELSEKEKKEKDSLNNLDNYCSLIKNIEKDIFNNNKEKAIY